MSEMAPEGHDDGCRRCGRETRDHAYGCEDCADDLARELGECPWLDDQLTISITRQHSANAGTGGQGTRRADLLADLAAILEDGKTGHMGNPWHETASRAQRALRSTLALWVTYCADQHVRHQNTHDHLPADNIPAMSRYLMWRVDGLMLHEDGPAAVNSIVKACAEARRIVLWKPPVKFYLAKCEVPTDGVPCDGDVYGIEGEDDGKCEDCGAIHEIARRRIELTKRLDGHLCTAADIARMAVYLGLQAKRETVRNKVNVWHKRGRIVAKSHAANGDPMFSYGEVRSLLAASFEKTEKVGS